ncbi:fusaric acid resistance family protein [Micromonospora palomenae]|uniref:Fusaric acid resistance family protein n=1 Tax=Micromonospora palomenae TaxID=1461247 RepID=A0A561WTB3_9ACTN|nr:FUSC family protein [Micromonospora palomenae]TWG27096.1 fusaric acid resistance family protein [Micromonospora palomenae]
MAADRSPLPRPEEVVEQARELATQAARRGGTAGRLRLRLRLRQVEIILVIAAQCGLAATLAWGLAHEVAGRPAPVFAPSAAVGTIVAALGQRARRTAELMLGVGLGLLISDFLLRYVGFGAWQIGVVVALAIAVALLMTGHSGALVAQAGSTAVLLATLSPVQGNLEWERIVEAASGAVVGLAVVALLVPIDPMRTLQRAAAPLTETLTSQLREVAHALRERDADRAVRALDRLRGMDGDLSRLHEALGGAEEVTMISPVRWQRRRDVARYQHGIQYMDRVALECRGIARWAATSLQYDEPVPEELIAAVERLAETIEVLQREARKAGPAEQTRNAVLDIARLVGQACRKGLKSYGSAMVVQLRTAASDLLRATGYEPETGNRMVREAVNL